MSPHPFPASSTSSPSVREATRNSPRLGWTFRRPIKVDATGDERGATQGVRGRRSERGVLPLDEEKRWWRRSGGSQQGAKEKFFGASGTAVATLCGHAPHLSIRHQLPRRPRSPTAIATANNRRRAILFHERRFKRDVWKGKGFEKSWKSKGEES